MASVHHAVEQTERKEGQGSLLLNLFLNGIQGRDEFRTELMLSLEDSPAAERFSVPQSPVRNNAQY